MGLKEGAGMGYAGIPAVPPPRTLSDEYWLLSHNDVDGKGLLDDEVSGSGLAGALLAELILAGRLDIHDRRLWVRDVRTYGDGLLDLIVSMVAASREPMNARRWVQAVRDAPYAVGGPQRGRAISLIEAVGLRLVKAGLVREQQARGLFKSAVRLVPVSWTVAAQPAIRIGYYLSRPDEIDTETRVLARLATIVGLEGQIGAGQTFPVRPAIEAVCERLHPEGHEVLAMLLDGVDKAVAAVALRIRR